VWAAAHAQHVRPEHRRMKKRMNPLWSLCVAALLLLGGCSPWMWKPMVVAVGWSTRNTPVVLEWVPTGASAAMGHGPPRLVPGGGYYRLTASDGKSSVVDVLDLGVCEHLDALAPVHFWYYMVDERRLLAMARRCGHIPPAYAVDFDLSKNRMTRRIELNEVPKTSETALSLGLTYQASATEKGLILTDLGNHEKKTIFPNCRTRFPRFSRNTDLLAALIWVPDDQIDSFTSKEKLTRLPVYMNKLDAYRKVETEAWVGISIVSVPHGNVIDVKTPGNISKWAFADSAYSVGTRPADRWNLLFDFAPGDLELLFMGPNPQVPNDPSDTSLFNSVRAMGPYVSPDGTKAGFFARRSSIYWWDLKTGATSQFDVH